MQTILHGASTSTQFKTMISAWEAKLKIEEAGEPSVEEWENLITDPGNTRGWLTMFKQTIHLYWLMKCIIVKVITEIQVGEWHPHEDMNPKEIQKELQSIHL